MSLFKSFFVAMILVASGFLSGCQRIGPAASAPPPIATYPFAPHLTGPVTYQGRVSTSDPAGANADFVMISPGESWQAPPISGPGEITHIWLTGTGEPFWEKFTVLRAFWDHAPAPAIDVPLGDFFLMGDGKTWRVDALPLKVTNPVGGYTSYFVMPFNKEARFEILNQGSAPLAFWMHIDYRLGRLPPRPLYFHARYRQEFPTRGWGDTRHLLTRTPASAEHAMSIPSDPAENYMVLDARGAGYYLGCYLLIENDSFGWVGEGDDRIVVDGEEQPRFLGTGLEDYFGSGFGFQRGQTPLFGVLNTHAGLPGNMHSAYRFHFEDPIQFRKSIHVSFEHGEANYRSDDYASVAYFYLDQPGGPAQPLPPAAQRLTTEMAERLLIIRNFEDMAQMERDGDLEAALQRCEQAIFELSNPVYRELAELKKGGLLIRTGRHDEARAWIEVILPRQTYRDRREFAAALLDWLCDPDPDAALLLVRGDDIFTLSMNGKPLCNGDLNRPWMVYPITMEPGLHTITAAVHNIGYFGGLAALVLRRDGTTLATGPDWMVSDSPASLTLSGAPGARAPVQLYDYPAGNVRSPWDMNAFHILGADVPWVWGRVNNLAGQTLYFVCDFDIPSQ